MAPVSNPLTPTQQRAVAARGNVLVMAGAGTGKTKTLIERCLDCIEREGAAVDGMLIVTFTEAAAAEMRSRLRAAIEVRTLAEPANAVWAEQLARFDLAHIGTLHSFCLKLVREHFYELGLDPRMAMLDEGEARQVANETLDELFDAHYAGEDKFSEAVQELIQTHGRGQDDQIRKLVLQIHNYSQARPDAAGWLAAQRGKFSADDPAGWLAWLRDAIANWRVEWLSLLQGLAGNEKAAELAALLRRLTPLDAPDSSGAANAWRPAAADLLAQVVAADGPGHWPAKRKIVLRKPLEDIFAEAEFLHSLAVVKDGVDPLAQDWSWIRAQMETLLQLAEEFGQQMAEHKRADGVLDFQDLEQFALKLLWDFATGRPSAVAESWRARLKFVFVDEYQDINAAQDKIIQGLSRAFSASGPPQANRFLVGDVKQSIYRFRLADPRIFRDYAQHWRPPAGQTIPLLENFRSPPALLALVNSIFRVVMREEIGGVAYDADAELKPAPNAARSPAASDIPGPSAELLVRFKSARNEVPEEGSETAGLDATQCEARLVAWHLKQLAKSRPAVFDERTKSTRPMEWRDVAILLRSPRGRSEVFAKEFERAGIPLAVARGGFYESAEILDIISLLQVLDNPLQDVPCIAVLRSPLVGLSLDELAEIRLAAPGGRFWTAVNRKAREAGNKNSKLAKFLERHARWRKLAKLVSLSQCLEEVLAGTHYSDWLRAQPRGAQRQANLAGFLRLAQQFDQFQRQGLHRFLRFVEAQLEAGAEPDISAAPTENTVRLMSIHQSKGLEFPVVVLVDLAKGFNERDRHSDIIFDEEFGLCPKVKPPQTGRRYPSLPHWLAQRRQRRELRGEELRLLYVAMTRARDHLILTASITQKQWDEKWNPAEPLPVTVRRIAAAKSFADWLALWFSNQPRPADAEIPDPLQGKLAHLRWRVVPDAEFGGPVEEGAPIDETEIANFTLQPVLGIEGRGLEELRARLKWHYPFDAATRRPAKSSVTLLRREAEDLDDEAEPMFFNLRDVKRLKGRGAQRKLSAAEVGAAHHKFLQHLSLAGAADLAMEADRLARENYLTADERAVLDFSALGRFWNSDVGRKILAHPDAVRRELPFTARVSPADLAAITGQPMEPGLENEFVIVQGVADLAVVRPDEIWLVDFKTDELDPRELPAKVKIYRPQLQLYAAALEKIFGRKVTLKALHFLAAGVTEEV